MNRPRRRCLGPWSHPGDRPSRKHLATRPPRPPARARTPLHPRARVGARILRLRRCDSGDVVRRTPPPRAHGTTRRPFQQKRGSARPPAARSQAGPAVRARHSAARAPTRATRARRAVRPPRAHARIKAYPRATQPCGAQAALLAAAHVSACHGGGRFAAARRGTAHRGALHAPFSANLARRDACSPSLGRRHAWALAGRPSIGARAFLCFLAIFGSCQPISAPVGSMLRPEGPPPPSPAAPTAPACSGPAAGDRWSVRAAVRRATAPQAASRAAGRARTLKA
ncbi:hypothetical protein PsYK624_089210 [Phanerochaete sordida]|uniref:Uncharacterized protein n=1 Tax=Phanerochaete sordida TaxID=48140 RepID=A0A9P3GDI8_9APHY|nr:hypothetical protein PsYK624_089210 [Phanerochaete sordida]